MHRIMFNILKIASKILFCLSDPMTPTSPDNIVAPHRQYIPLTTYESTLVPTYYHKTS